MMIQVIDNFIDGQTFTHIKDTILSETFPWFWGEVQNGSKGLLTDPLYNFQHVHTFCVNDLKSSYYDLLIPVFKKLRVRQTIRVKVNSTPKTDNIERHAFHIDLENNSSTTAVYYLNTCDGFTEFFDGKKVESVENRIVVFNSNIKHLGTTCTNQKRRVVLNLNYY